ncbi:MAG: c-type cytochrome biogenesis protein CcmI [Nitrospiria bacterium]
MFPFLITSLLAIVIGILILPFFRRADISLIVGQAASQDEEQVNLNIERQTIASSLSELEVDYEQARISAADYERTKLEFEHRLLEILDRLDQFKKSTLSRLKRKGKQSASTGKVWLSVIFLGFLVGGGSTGTYKLVHWKFAQESVVSDNGMAAQPPINPAEMVARLEKRLKENPDDLQGQMMIGRSYIAMERWAEAKKAFKKVLEMEPLNYTAHYRLGEILLSEPSTGDISIAEEALAHFDKALNIVPQDASILWARGIVLLQLGRTFEADESWTEAFQYIPRGTEESEMVKKALEDIRAGRMPTAP